MSTAIEWATDVWNPTVGCTKISEGCRWCYIERQPPLRMTGRRFVDPRGRDSGNVGATTGVSLHPERLLKPLHRRIPERYFVNSMSDLFHDEIPDAFIARVFAVMALCQDGEAKRTPHVFQVLTKRPARMAALLRSEDFDRLVFDARSELCDQLGTDGGRVYTPLRYGPIPNVWLGTSVEDQHAAELRIPKLLATPAAVRFLSCEPLIGPVDLAPYLVPVGPSLPDEALDDPVAFAEWRNDDTFAPLIQWVIAGGESGLPKVRPMHPDWPRQLRDQCREAGVAYFFKQQGSWALGEHTSGDRAVWVLPDGLQHPFDGHTIPKGGAVMHYCGSSPKAGGRELDGREWNELPQKVGSTP